MNPNRMWILAALAPVLAAGCGNGPAVYREPTDTTLAMALTPRATWTASGDIAGAEKAIDNNLATAAVTTGDYAGQSITLHLQKACLFQTIIIDHGGDEMGFADRVEAATSMDGKNFETQYTTIGTRRVTILSLPRPVLARHVRLRAVRAGARPWSLAEIYLQ